MTKPMFNIVNKDGILDECQTSSGCHQPYSIQHTIPLTLTEDECQCLYDGTYYAITHEKSYETWRDEKIANNIICIKEE